MRLLVCGDRNWTDSAAIFAELGFMHGERPLTAIIHGDCEGADRIAGAWANTHNVEERPCPADWTLGLRAGPMRNARMLAQERPDAVLAFHDRVERSRGTWDMLHKALNKGLPVTLWTHRDGAVRWNEAAPPAQERSKCR